MDYIGKGQRSHTRIEVLVNDSDHIEDINDELLNCVLRCAGGNAERAKALLGDPRWVIGYYCGLDGAIEDTIETLDHMIGVFEK